MTFDEFNEFKTDFLRFLDSSTVNLGRKTAKTRLLFMEMAKSKLDFFGENFILAETCDSNETKSPKPVNDSILCIKPKDKNRALDIGKGAHAMTSSESMRADEELDRSPYGNNKGKKNND